jgi:hypothetical protein
MFRMRLKEHLHKLPRRFAGTLHMKISNLILLASLLVATEAAQAGKPVLGTVIESDHIYPWEMQRINASEWAESGDATNPNKSQGITKTRIDNVIKIRVSLPDRLYSEISWLRGHFSQFCYFLGAGPNFCTLQRQSSCALEFVSCEQHFPVGRA